MDVLQYIVQLIFLVQIKLVSNIKFFDDNLDTDECDALVYSETFGGTPPYSYNWNNIESNSNINNFNVTSLCAGENILSILDSYGCIFVDTVVVGPIVYGCTDDSQFNYDELANTDDGSCIPFIYGCTDFLATNYNELANIDDSSCEYPQLENACDITPNGLFVDNIIHNRVRFNWSEPMLYPSHYMIK